MIVALDPGWYIDPYGDDRTERYHNGDRWTGRTRLVGAVEELVEPDVHLRSTALRILITVAAVVLLLAASTMPAFVPALAHVARWWEVGLLIVLAVFSALAAPVVASGEGSGLMFVPVLGVRFFPLLVWRLTLLPYRDTQVDADDPRWRQIFDPSRPGTALYVRQRSH